MATAQRHPSHGETGTSTREVRNTERSRGSLALRDLEASWFFAVTLCVSGKALSSAVKEFSNAGAGASLPVHRTRDAVMLASRAERFPSPVRRSGSSFLRSSRSDSRDLYCCVRNRPRRSVAAPTPSRLACVAPRLGVALAHDGHRQVGRTAASTDLRGMRLRAHRAWRAASGRANFLRLHLSAAGASVRRARVHGLPSAAQASQQTSRVRELARNSVKYGGGEMASRASSHRLERSSPQAGIRRHRV